MQWRTGIFFGLAGMVGAYAGGLLSQFVPGTVLLLAFAVMMVATAVAMLRGRKSKSTAEGGSHSMPIGKVLLDGVVVGLVTGLVGAGGGFLVVPALALLGGLSMPLAIGTSLIVIAMKSFAGLGGYLSAVQIDWRLAAMVTGAAVVGTVMGGRLTSIVDPDALRKGFGWFVLLMSSVILAQEIHPAVGVAVAVLTLTAAGTTYACARREFCPLRRLLVRRGAHAVVG